MSIFNLLKTSFSFSQKKILSHEWLRTIFISNPSLCDVYENERTETVESEAAKIEVPSLSECLRYMKSKAYTKTYGQDPVWKTYVRNFKGRVVPKTRKSCLNSRGEHKSASPCPICRDIYLQPHYLNVDLIKQFISPYGGEIIDSKITGVCQLQQKNLIVAIQKAKNYGLLTFYIPHRHYNYEFYNK